MTDKPVFGIDLGTTNSCIAMFKNGKITTLDNKYNKSTTPSVVAFTPDGSLVGELAISQQCLNPQNTIFEAKRIIGQKFDRIKRQYLPFKITQDNKDRPCYNVQVHGAPQQILPEQIAALILKDLKESAEFIIQQKVEDVVITVPAYFNEIQRCSTEISAKLAGFNVLNILTEPVAAALAICYERELTTDMNILVYDLGGGTFDTAIVSINVYGTCEVLATNGNTKLGGAKFVDLLMEYFATELSVDMKLFSEKKSSYVRTACETAKIDLSTAEETEIMVFNEKVRITRAEYNIIIQPYVSQTMNCVRETVKMADMDTEEVDEIVLVGGATHTPYIRETLQEIFGGIVINTEMNPMLTVAYGACVQAAILAKKAGLPPLLVKNVTPLTISVLGSNRESGLKYCRTIFKRNTTYPAEEHLCATTTANKQSNAVIVLVEESPAGVEKMDVAVKISDEGCIFAVVIDRNTKNRASLKIEKQSPFDSLEFAAINTALNAIPKAIEIGFASEDDDEDGNHFDIEQIRNRTSKKQKVDENQSVNQSEECPIYGQVSTEIYDVDDDTDKEIEINNED